MARKAEVKMAITRENRSKFEEQGETLTKLRLLMEIENEQENLDAQRWLAEQDHKNSRQENLRYWWMLGFTVIAAVTGSIAAWPIIKEWF
jgi:hypothetical protein